MSIASISSTISRILSGIISDILILLTSVGSIVVLALDQNAMADAHGIARFRDEFEDIL